MEIKSLKCVATQLELNELLSKHFETPGANIRNLHARLVPDRLCLSGLYRAAVNVSFESRWELSVDEGRIAARLDKLKAGFLGLGAFKGYVLDAVAAKFAVIARRGDSLSFDPDWLLSEYGIPLRTNLTAVRCLEGQLIIESGDESSSAPRLRSRRAIRGAACATR